MDQPIPIVCLVFIVWKYVNGQKKGRTVVDLCPLNVVTVLDVYLLPDQDDMMADMIGKKCFMVFDALGFFYQLPVVEEYKDCMVVISLRGLERLNVVLMGFKNLPAFVQRFMDRLFFKYCYFVRVYIDDIVVFSLSFEEYLKYLKIVLEIIDKARLYISVPKSFAGYLAVRLLGYIVNREGTAKTDNRIAAFKKLKFPNTLDDLEYYLGMAGWLRRGISWFVLKVDPLQRRKTEMLAEVRKKGELPIGKSKNVRKVYTSKAKFDLTLEELESFCLLQEYLYKQYFLYYYCMDKPLFVKIDTCRKGYSAFVFQLKGYQDGYSIPGRDIPVLEIQPVLFLSRLTTNVEKKYGAIESEVAIVVWVVRKIWKIIQSNRQPTNILTDYAATKGIVKYTSFNTIDLTKANLKLANVANWLSQFELNIFYISRELNIVSDALLCLLTLEEEVSGDINPANELVDIWSYMQNACKEQAFTTNEASIKLVISKELKAQIVAAYPKDLKYSKVYQALTDDLAPIKGTPILKRGRYSRPCLLYRLYKLKDNLLYYIDFDSTRRLYLPKSYIKPILKIVYNNKYYFSINKIIVDLNRLYFYKKLQIVRLFISYCETYRQNQIDRSPPSGNY